MFTPARPADATGRAAVPDGLSRTAKQAIWHGGTGHLAAQNGHRRKLLAARGLRKSAGTAIYFYKKEVRSGLGTAAADFIFNAWE